VQESGGFLARLRKRLSAGAGWLGAGLEQLAGGRRIDAASLEDLETRLLTADVGVEATENILADLRRRVARNELGDLDALLGALRACMLEILRPVARPLMVDARAKPFVILVVGVNGSGKTTSIGKLAHRLKSEGRSVMLAAGDTFRAAAIEQLATWAERNHVPIIAQQTGADPAAVIFDAIQAARARAVDVLIADTAGRLHVQTHLMEELKKVKRVIQRQDASAPHEVLLVLDAGTGQNALAQTAQFHEALGVTGIVLTKLDGTARGGIVLAMAQRFGLPIRFIGVGEQIEDFGPFDAQAFVDALLARRDAPDGSVPKR
jgi:fused signal recognition particle receptor